MKLAKDIAALVYHLRNEKSLPHTLLRNGKRSKQMYMQSRDQVKVQQQYTINLINNYFSKLTIISRMPWPWSMFNEHN